MRKLSSLVLTAGVILIVSVQAAAGIRIINNGGGYAEMIALTAFSRLKFLIAPCLKTPGACGLSDDEQKLVAERMQKGFFGEGTLEFHVPEHPGDIYRRVTNPHETFSISSPLLYENTDEPKSYREIARLIFVGLSQVDGGPNMEAVSHKLFSDMRIREFSLPLAPEDLVARVYTMGYMIEPIRNVSLIFENKKGSRDVTGLLAQATKCKEAPRILDLNTLSFEAPTLTGRMVWLCGQAKWEAQFALHTQTLHAMIFGKAISPFHSCEGDLL